MGGGAAGLFAALFALREGAETTVFERNEKPGKKIYITGKGRGNLTNTADPEAFLGSVVRNPRFFYSAFNFLDNEAVINLFESLGMPTKIERGGRVFPVSDHASDITRALEKEIRRLGGTIKLNQKVSCICAEADRITGLKTEDGMFYPSDAVILATGGLSYPSTGSTGDGYRFARELGHTVTDTRPSLVALDTEESWPGDLRGLTLKNVALCWQNGKKHGYREQGEMLFTHTGISGPLVLTLSAMLPDCPKGEKLSIDLKPALDEKTLDDRIQRDFVVSRNRQVLTVAEGLMPRALAAQAIRVAAIPPALPVHSVTQQQRAQLVRTVKQLPLTVRCFRGFDEAVITRGGVSVREVVPGSMESKLVNGLYFAGEVLDLDALTGGYNLQIAFSTGALAGFSAANSGNA